jgi:hypothetical protein
MEPRALVLDWISMDQAPVSSYHFLRRGRSTFTNAFRFFSSHAYLSLFDKGSRFVIATDQSSWGSITVPFGKLSRRYRLSDKMPYNIEVLRL